MARQCLVVAEDGSTSVWKRLPLGQTAGRNEAWLRDMLQARPELVPIAELDPTYGPLVPLCTELQTTAGRIDNVFIDPRGRLTLIECKLWGNSEARRKVVAQLLDYAKAVRQLSAGDLEARVAARAGAGTTLHELVRRRHPDVRESEFYDGVSRSLRDGRVQLLIAGDGIHEDVAGIRDLINQNAAAAFSFGLFQVELYQGPGGALLLQPRVVAQTRLIERTVIVLQDAGGLRLESVDATEDATEDDPSVARKIHEAAADWWTPVLAAPLQNRDQQPFRYYWPHNIRSQLPWIGTWITAYRSSKNSEPTIGVFVGGREHPLAELLRALAPAWTEMRENLPAGTEFESGRKLQVTRPLASFGDDDAARRWLIESINAFVNEIRPRASDLAT